jgi:hypothetical protein
MSLLLVGYVAGVVTSVGMLTARLNGARILELQPKVAYPFFLLLWPVAWLIGLGATLVAVWALLGAALARR